MSTQFDPSISLPEHDDDDAFRTSWAPTRKWVATAVGGVASVVASWVVTGAFDDVERGMTGALLVGLAAAYFKSDDA